jgi:hypothetical protein
VDLATERFSTTSTPIQKLLRPVDVLPPPPGAIAEISKTTLEKSFPSLSVACGAGIYGRYEALDPDAPPTPLLHPTAEHHGSSHNWKLINTLSAAASPGEVEAQIVQAPMLWRVSTDRTAPLAVRDIRTLVVKPSIGRIEGKRSSELNTDQQRRVLPAFLATFTRTAAADGINQIIVKTSDLDSKMIQNLVAGTGLREIDDFSARFDIKRDDKAGLTEWLVDGGLRELARDAVKASLNRRTALTVGRNGLTDSFDLDDREFEYIASAHSNKVAESALKTIEQALRAEAMSAVFNKPSLGAVPSINLRFDGDSHKIVDVVSAGETRTPRSSEEIAKLMASLPLGVFARLADPPKAVRAKVAGAIVEFEPARMAIGDQLCAVIRNEEYDLIAVAESGFGGGRAYTLVGEVDVARNPRPRFEYQTPSPQATGRVAYSDVFDRIRHSESRGALRTGVLGVTAAASFWHFVQYVDTGRNNPVLSLLTLGGMLSWYGLRRPTTPLRTPASESAAELARLTPKKKADERPSDAAQQKPGHQTSELAELQESRSQNAVVDGEGDPTTNATLTYETVSAEVVEANGSAGDV